MCHRPQRAILKRKSTFELKKKQRMNKSGSLWVRQTLKNVLFPRHRRWERLDCTDSENMSKMKHWRFVEIRIPASCCDSRREERSASGFDPALQIQPRILGWTFFFFRCLKRTRSYQRCSTVIRFLFLDVDSPDRWKRKLLPLPRLHTLGESAFASNRKQKLTRHKKHYCTLFPFLRNCLINISELINVVLYYSARTAQGNIARCAAFQIRAI